MAYSLDSQQKVWILSKFGFRKKSKLWDLFSKSRAMHLYQAGMPLAMLSEFLGHEDPQTTLIYARADVEMKRDALCRATEGNDVLQSNMEKPIWENDADIIGRLCRGY